jgi:hypothetical protein
VIVGGNPLRWNTVAWCNRQSESFRLIFRELAVTVLQQLGTSVRRQLPRTSGNERGLQDTGSAKVRSTQVIARPSHRPMAGNVVAQGARGMAAPQPWARASVHSVPSMDEVR